MPSKLERQWWFMLTVTALAAMLTNLLMGSAGLATPHGAAQWLLYMLAFAGLQRSLSFTGWLLVLWLAPARVLSERS